MSFQMSSYLKYDNLNNVTQVCGFSKLGLPLPAGNKFCKNHILFFFVPDSFTTIFRTKNTQFMLIHSIVMKSFQDAPVLLAPQPHKQAIKGGQIYPPHFACKVDQVEIFLYPFFYVSSNDVNGFSMYKSSTTEIKIHFSHNVLCQSKFFEPVQLFYALSFYRSQNVLCSSKFFEPAQKFIYTLCQLQTFCARQKDDLHSVKLVSVLAQKFLKRH